MIYLVDYYKEDEIKGGVQTLFSQLHKLFPSKLISYEMAIKHFDKDFKKGIIDSNIKASAVIDEYIKYLEKIDKPKLIIRNSLVGSIVKLQTPQISIINDNNVDGPEILMKKGVINFNNYNLMKNCYTLLQLIAINNSKKVISVSKSVAQSYKKEHNIDSIIISNSVDTKLFSKEDKKNIRKDLEIPLDKKVCIWNGSVSAIKGYKRIIEKLIRKYKDVTFILIFKELVEYVSPYKNVITFTNYPRERLPILYSAADFCIIPSAIETFSMVALEAMSCDLPIIMQETGLAKDLQSIGDYGLVVDDWEFDAYDLAFHQMLDLLNNNHKFYPRKFVLLNNYYIEKFKEKWGKIIGEYDGT